MAKRGGLGAQTRRDIASGKLTKRNSAPKKKKKETTAPQASSSSNRGGIGAQTRRDIESGNLTRQNRNAPGAVQVRHHEESSAPQFRRSNINSNINTNEYSDWRKSLRQRQKENNWQSQLRSAAEKRATRYEPGKYSGAKYSQNKTIGEQLPGRNNYREHRLEDSFDKALETNEAKWNSTSRTTGYFSAGGARQYYVKDKKGNWKESTFEAFDKQNRNDEKEAEKYRKLAISDPTAYARLKYADKKKSIDDKVAQYKSMTITEDNYKEAEKLYNEINKETDEYNKLMENAADLKDPRADWEHYSFGERARDTMSGTVKGRLWDAAYALYNSGNPEAITKAFSSRNEWYEKYSGNPEAQYEAYLKGLNKLDKKASKADQQIQAAQAHTGKGKRFALETLGAVTGMGMDIGAGAATGAGTIPMMMLSASGGAARQANTDEFGQNKMLAAYQQGGMEAAQRQQEINRRYGAVTGAIEGMSEKIFAVGAPMQKLVGKGAISGDKIARTFARRLAKTDAGRELVTAFSKAGISMSGEGFEEVVAGVLEPIADKMIVNKDKDLDWGQIAKDSFHDAMIGGAIGGLFGGAEIANQYQQGKFVKADVGSEELVKKGLRASEKSEAHEIASQLKDQVEQTGTINAFEAQALAQALESPENDAERRRKYVEAERKTSQTIIDDYGEKAVYAGSVKDEYNARKAYRESNQNISEEELDDGTTNLDQVKEYENTVSETMQAMEEKLLGSRVGDEYTVDEEEQALSDEDRGMVEKVAEAVANISVGEASYEDYQMFTEVDPVARESIEEVLGITLPEGNDATVDALIELNMNNRLDTFGNKVEEGVVAVARQQLGKEGYPVFVQEMKNHNVSKDDYATAYKVYAYFYDAGVDGSVPYHKVPVPALDALQEGRIKESFLRAAYINGRTEAKQNQEKRESKVRKAKKKKSASFVDETSAEFNAGLSARKAKTLDGLREALKGLSEAWGVTIHLVDPAVLGGANGTYSGGVITISADTDQPLLETFTHEFMHRMEKLAPKQWKAYCDFVKQKMNEKDPGSFSRAVSRQLKLYDKSAKTRLKDRNDAIFEVVAESTKALFVDENFVNDLARQDASLASKIASVLRDMFEALKQVIERLNWYRAKQNEFSALFSDMETLEKAKDLWLAAAEAQMTNEVVEQSDGKQYKIRIGMSDEERYEELKDKTIHLCDYNHDAIESIPAGIMRRFAMAKRREARTDMRSFAESLGVIGKTFTRDGGDLTATFTSNNYKESFSQQMNIASDERLVQFAKMLTCMEDIVESAEEIERHNPGKENEDKDLKEIRVFVSAFRDDGFVIPVKLLVKEYFEKEDGLYVTMTLDKIKETALHDQSHNEHRSLTISDYKLSELLGEVKKNGNRALAKYIPEQFAKDSAKSNGQKSLKDLDADYMAAVKAGDMKKAQKMVDEAAERAGYKYKGYHGTIDNFNVFSKELQGRNWDGDSRLGKGFYFAFDEHTAQEWTEGTRVVSAFLHMRKPLDLRREAPKDIIARIDAYIDRKIDSYDESYPISREQFVKNVRRIQEIYKNDPGTFLDQFKYDDYGEMTDGIRELLEEMGYDGIIAEDEMVVFESNQIKSADPVTYDDKGNVIPLSKRFSEESDDIRFSLKAPVEETRDLLAVHNVTERKFLATLGLGGFPMPSIAVTNQDHTNFGDISILFDKSTIDPQTNRNNKVYSADVWSPTVPRTEYEADYDRVVKIRSRINELVSDPWYSGEANRDLNSSIVEDNLNRNGGFRGLIDHLMDRGWAKYAFLKSKGESIAIRQKEDVKKKPWSENRVDVYKEIVDAFGLEGAFEQYNTLPKNRSEEDRQRLINIVAKHDSRLNGRNKGPQNLIISSYLRETKEWIDNPDAVDEINQVNDYSATERMMDERIDRDEMRSWLYGMFDGVIGKEGIYNGKDPFTPAGNSRSFSQLHYPVSAENIVKAMKAQGDRNVSVTHGIKPLRAELARSYRTIDEIRKDKSKLKALDNDELRTIQEELDAAYEELLNEIASANPGRSYDNPFMRLDSFAETIEEAARVNAQPAYIQQVFAKYNYEVPLATAKKIAALYNAVYNMPVFIFEAKPQRVVGFDEIKQVIIPSSSSQELRDALDERNIPYTEYDAEEENARIDAVNKAADEQELRFSIVDDYTDNQGRHYDQIVLTDSKIFEGKNFRGREKALHDFVYNKLSGTGTFAYDNNGNSQYIEFAKENERVRKSGAKNSHKVLDKLAKKQNIVDQYAVAHATELIEVSRPDEGNEHTKEHGHQWLDENGWDYRKVYLLTTDGKILEAILNIGVARDGRKILYDVNKINTVGDGVVPHNSGAAKTSNGENNVAQIETESNTKRQLSLNDYVSLSPERITSLIDEYAIPGATTNNYSKAWIASIDPRDFLRLTVRDEVLDTWQPGTSNEWGQEVRDLDAEDLKRTRHMPYLIIDSDESHSVIGHEGRHRMLALMRAGYTNIPVVIRDISESSKMTKESMDTMDLWSQDFGSGPVNSDDEVGRMVEVFDVIPIREQNRKEIEDTFGTDGKVQFQMKDSEGNELSPAQQRYFRDSKVRDSDGNLKVMYHGSPYSFTVFDRSKAKSGNLGRGFYFTDSPSHAGQYGNLYPVYLNIVDPLDGTTETKNISKEQLTAFVERIAEDEDYGIENYGEYASVESVVDDIWGKADFAMIQDLDLTCIGDMVEALKVFNEVNGTSYDGIITSVETVTFESMQAKNIDNTNPTVDSDIRFSLNAEESVSYEVLVAKDDLELVTVEPKAFVSDKELLRAARDNVRSQNNPNNTDKALFVYVEDIGKNVLTGRKGITHRYKTVSDAKATVLYHLGDYLKNAIRVNYTNPKDPEAISAYVLLGCGKDQEGNLYPGYFVVNEYENKDPEIYDFDALHKLHSGTGRKIEPLVDTENPPTVRDGDNKSLPHEDSTISIEELLQLVNEMLPEEDIFTDIFSKDVLNHFRKERSGSPLGEGMKYQLVDDELDPETARLYEKIDELRSQMKLSKGTLLADKDARNLVKELFDMPGYIGKAKLNETIKRVKNIYALLAKDETMDEGLSEAMALAREIVDNSVDEESSLPDDAVDQLNAVKAWLKQSRIYLTKEQKTDISADWGDWYRSHKKVFPHLMSKPENGTELDRWLLEFNEQFPGIIDEARISPADQFLDVANWVESMENDREVLVDSSHPYYNEMVNSVASVIFDRMDQAVPAKNFADRKQAEKKAAVEKERDKSKQRTAKLREKKNAEKDAAVERTKEHYKQLIKEIREEKNMSTEQKLRRRMQKEQERDRRRKDRQQRRNLRSRIERDAKDLSNMLLKPTEKKHIPFGYDKAIAKMLNSLDFETQYSDAWIEKYGKPSKRVMDLRDLREQYAKIVASDTTEIEANDYMLMMIESLAIKTEGLRLSELDTRTLSEVRTLVEAIKFQISHINQAFTDDIQQTISELGDATIEYFSGLDDQKISGGAVGRARDFVNVTNAKPIDFFDRVGSPLQTVFQEIVKGEDTHIRNIQAVKQYIEEIKKKYGKNAFDTWSGEKAEAQTFDLSDGSSIELTPAQVMSLYALNRRDQARGHMYASGIVVAPVQRNMKNKLKKKLFGDKLMKTHVHVTYADVIKITSQMTKEQKEVADAFLRFLNGQCAEWGNQTSMRLYGYESFREKNYFPIKSSEMFLNESTSEKQNAISKLKNTGFTKATVEYADNPIVIDDFFRVCANHINTMSMYNAFVPAITDFERVYNYNDRSGRGIESSVKQSINRKMGNAVNNYINTLLQDLNTQYNKDQNGLTIADELLRRWKSVKIGANARVLVQQPTAITRAQVYIDYKYLAQSLATNANPATASKTKKRMWDTCPIAYWKHLGFAQTDVSREMQDIIMGNEDSKWNRLAFGTYGFADDVSWTRIFGAVEAETRAKHPELREGSREWKEHVNERFRYIVDRTQVVDSTLHRSQIMRSKDFFMRSLTSFMAEPTTQINMWMTMLKTARDQISSGDKSGAARTMTRFGQNYLISMITLSVAASLISAMRDSWTGDDDDKWKDKPFIEKWLKHYAIEDFKGNINLLNQLPYAKDIMSIANGYEVKRADLSLVADAITSVKKFKEYFDKDGDVKYSWKKLALDAAEDCAALFGVPVGNLEKDIMASRKAFFNVMKDADYAHFKEDSFELNPAKNKSKFIEYYLNSLEKGNDETSDEIKKFLNDNDISDDDIDKVIKKRLNSEVNAAIDEEKPEKIKRILDKYKKNYDYTSEDVMKKVRTYFNEDLKSAIEDADADKIKKIMKDQKRYGMSSDEVEENVHYWTNRYYKKALEADNTDKLDNYDKILRIAGMSKDEIYLNRGNYYIGYYDMLIYNAGSQAEKRRLARKVARLFPDMTDEEYIMNFVSTTESKQNLSNWPKGKWTKASISKRRNR